MTAEADQEQREQEDALWPWLADESMADQTYDPSFEEFYQPPEPDEFCDECGCGLFDEEDECPGCGKHFSVEERA